MASSNSKKPRKPKTSYKVDSKTGAKVKNTPNSGARKAPQTPLALVLMNKGAHQCIKLNDSKRALAIIAGQQSTHKKKSDAPKHKPMSKSDRAALTKAEGKFLSKSSVA